MLREIITPQTQNYTLHIPAEYLNRKVEILVLPFSNEDDDSIDSSANMIKKTAGILSSQNIDPLKWQAEIRDKWEDRL